MEIELKKAGIPYEREKTLPIIYDGLKQIYRADFACYGNNKDYSAECRVT
ncbi:MAG: GxxExxY protein [Treponema sp.]|nr:GxxExxY protein [Treponema sp.]